MSCGHGLRGLLPFDHSPYWPACKRVIHSQPRPSPWPCFEKWRIVHLRAPWEVSIWSSLTCRDLMATSTESVCCSICRRSFVWPGCSLLFAVRSISSCRSLIEPVLSSWWWRDARGKGEKEHCYLWLSFGKGHFFLKLTDQRDLWNSWTNERNWCNVEMLLLRKGKITFVLFGN